MSQEPSRIQSVGDLPKSPGLGDKRPREDDSTPTTIPPNLRPQQQQQQQQTLAQFQQPGFNPQLNGGMGMPMGMGMNMNMMGMGGMGMGMGGMQPMQQIPPVATNMDAVSLADLQWVRFHASCIYPSYPANLIAPVCVVDDGRTAETNGCIHWCFDRPQRHHIFGTQSQWKEQRVGCLHIVRCRSNSCR